MAAIRSFFLPIDWYFGLVEYVQFLTRAPFNGITRHYTGIHNTCTLSGVGIDKIFLFCLTSARLRNHWNYFSIKRKIINRAPPYSIGANNCKLYGCKIKKFLYMSVYVCQSIKYPTQGIGQHDGTVENAYTRCSELCGS